MKLNFFKLSVISLFFASGSLMAKMTSYDVALDAQNFGMLNYSLTTDVWSTTTDVDGFIFNVKVVVFTNGSKDISVPSKVLKGLDYMLIDDCSFDIALKDLKCHYETYSYIKTVVDSEPVYFDVLFFREVAREIYENSASGFFHVKRP
jgi:hypothetical protein